jgi:hypothetical protein
MDSLAGYLPLGTLPKENAYVKLVDSNWEPSPAILAKSELAEKEDDDDWMN